jgi:hypothetical protein
MTRTGICLLFLSALSLGGCSRSLDTQQMVRSLDDLRAEVQQLNERLRDLDEREQNASDKKSELLSAAAAAYRTKFECVAANLANAETVYLGRCRKDVCRHSVSGTSLVQCWRGESTGGTGDTPCGLIEKRTATS